MRWWVSKLYGVFDKRYEQTFTDKLFTVYDRIPKIPPVYKLKDYDSGEMTLCVAELQKLKTALGELYHVEKVLQVEMRNGNKWVLVHWKNLPEKFNNWILAELNQNLV